MRAYTLSRDGLRPANAQAVTASSGQQFLALLHGQEGRGRWQVRLPLARREFPPDASTSLEGVDLKLVDLGRKDPRGHHQLLLARGQEDDTQLILWSLDPGYRGGATYTASGQARILAEGQEAQGAAGRMGGAPCPLVLVEGPCALRWQRTGRLYGSPAQWVAEFDGARWTVGPEGQCAAEAAALSY